jgi:eukaryotic-like serine/threonine-protein kinase
VTLHASTVIVIAFATAVVTSIGTTLLTQRVSGGAAVGPTSEVIVPDFSGLTEADARANATTARLAILIAGREGAAGKRPGTVMRQSVPPGQRVPEQHPVSLVIADDLPKVPNLGGLSAAEATARLEQAGFKATVVARIPDPKVPEDKILAQTPAADTPLEKGAAVSLRVSSGPAAIEVPQVVGIVVSQAKRKLEEQGFKPVVEWANMAESQGLIVLRQTPEAGQKAKPGSEVKIVANQ